MPVQSNFIVSTDYPTLKNDAEIEGQIIIDGSLSIAGGSYETGYADVEIGEPGSLTRTRIASSKNSNTFYWGQVVVFGRTGTNGGSPAPYDIFVFVNRISLTTLRFQAYIPNPYGTTLTGEAGTDTITIKTNTYIAPYA